MTSANNLLGTFEQVVLLAVLRIGDGAYAPLVRKELEEGLGRHVSRGSVYVTLDRLERKGLLRSSAGEAEPERGGHPKRYLAVTEKGAAALGEARDALASFWHGVDVPLEP
jgi:PadR family transcriptional regulator PadR